MTSSRRRSLTLRTCAATAALLLAAACSDSTQDAPTPDEPTTSETSEEPADVDPTEEEPSTEPSEEEPTAESTDTDGPRVTGDSYSYAVPEGWEDIIDTPEAQGADTFVRSTSPVDGFATNVNTVIAPSSISTLTADTPRLQQVRAQFAKSTRTETGVLPQPIDDTEIAGSFAIGHTVEEFEAQGTTVTITQYATVRDSISYVITVTAATADADVADAAASTVIESWTWE